MKHPEIDFYVREAFMDTICERTFSQVKRKAGVFRTTRERCIVKYETVQFSSPGISGSVLETFVGQLKSSRQIPLLRIFLRGGGNLLHLPGSGPL